MAEELLRRVPLIGGEEADVGYCVAICYRRGAY
jgi:hypothetical protein